MHLVPVLGVPSDNKYTVNGSSNKNVVEKVYNPSGGFIPSPLNIYFYFFIKVNKMWKFIPYIPCQKTWSTGQGGGVARGVLTLTGYS